MCGSLVDIQSAIAENRQRKRNKEEERRRNYSSRT